MASWWKNAVFYQIYPRSFADSNGDGIGDLPGIMTHLDYLQDGSSRSLGIDAIWLSPFFPSPMADLGYDISDHQGVAGIFGNLNDFDALITEAHRRDIRVIIDWIPNHTSEQHPWFRESRSSRTNPKRDWYVWRGSAPDGGPPNNWRSFFPQVGPSWTFDDPTGQWYLHSFLAQQPDLNWDNPAVEEAMHDVLRFWLDRGVDGFRIDALPLIGKHPSYPDNPEEEAGPPGAWGRYNIDWPSVHDRLRSVRRLVEGYGDRVIVGEVNVLRLERLVAYVNGGDELHLVHNFLFPQQPWEAPAFRRVVDELERQIATRAWPSWYLGNHDHARVATRYGEGVRGVRRARVAAMMMLTLRGTPFLYQGEELGLADVPVPVDRVFDIDGRDPQRAPMPWVRPSAGGPGAGFTRGEPWLPIPADAEQVNVESMRADLRSIWTLYRRLITCRRQSMALRSGSYRSIDLDGSVFAFVRESSDERILVALNLGNEPERVDSREWSGQTAQMLLSTDPDRGEGPIELRSTLVEVDEGIVVRLP
jgi:alpha-glucosidase